MRQARAGGLAGGRRGDAGAARRNATQALPVLCVATTALKHPGRFSTPEKVRPARRLALLQQSQG